MQCNANELDMYKIVVVVSAEIEMRNIEILGTMTKMTRREYDSKQDEESDDANGGGQLASCLDLHPLK